ncbi:MAG: helix-turn-helix transcriptional regulator [Pseudomonadota bacterium]
MPDPARFDAPGPALPLGDDTLYPPEDVAEMLRTTVRTLADWRHRGCGPRFCRLGRNRVAYRLRDLRDFIHAGLSPEGGSDG